MRSGERVDVLLVAGALGEGARRADKRKQTAEEHQDGGQTQATHGCSIARSRGDLVTRLAWRAGSIVARAAGTRRCGPPYDGYAPARASVLLERHADAGLGQAAL